MTPLVLQYVMAALQLLPTLVSVGGDVTTWIANLKGVVGSNTDPTPAQWAALNTQMLAALTALQAAKPAA
jgi:hypothetical protein